MEDAKSTDEEDKFFDAFDEFVFYDWPETFGTSFLSYDNSSSLPQSTVSFSSPVDAVSSGGNIRRRSSRRKLHRNLTNREFGTGKSLDFETTELTSTSDVVSSVFADDMENAEDYTITTGERSAGLTQERETDDGQISLLGFLAELLVKAIGFQFNLLISLITFPFSALYYGLMVFINPFYVIGLGRSYMIGKLMRLWKIVCDAYSPFLSEWIKEHKSWLNLVMRFGWGLFWSVYVCSVLVSLLVLAFIIGGLIMRFYVVEEPFQLKQPLNFDYTKSKPQAFVPITNCRVVERGEKIDGASVGSSARVIPPNQKLQATVTMVLPESDYNQNLGIFQVRVEFLSENGKSLASLSHPSMLGFKSKPIRLLLTFFKIIPLVAGYVSESQTLTLKFRGYTESVIPTGCLKVTIEQRAEFRSRAGIPEVYDALLHLESDLSFLKRILWYWRKTIFVWLSMMLFVMELLCALLCCRPIILPRARTRGNAARNGSPSRNHPVQM